MLGPVLTETELLKLTRQHFEWQLHSLSACQSSIVCYYTSTAHLPNLLLKIPSVWVFNASLERLFHSLNTFSCQEVKDWLFSVSGWIFHIVLLTFILKYMLATFYPENLFQSFTMLALQVLNNTWVTHIRDQLEVLKLELLTVSKYCIILREWEETHFLSKASAEGHLLVRVRLHLWHPSGWTSTLFNFLPEQYVVWCSFLPFFTNCVQFFT